MCHNQKGWPGVEDRKITFTLGQARESFNVRVGALRVFDPWIKANKHRFAPYFFVEKIESKAENPVSEPPSVFSLVVSDDGAGSV